MPTVLIAVANFDQQAQFHDLLPGNFVVEVASNGLECIARLRQLAPELLVLDLDLPWGGGDGVLAYLAEEPSLRPKWILIVAGPQTGSSALWGFLRYAGLVAAVNKSETPSMNGYFDVNSDLKQNLFTTPALLGDASSHSTQG